MVLCLSCRGKLVCGRKFCPIYHRFAALAKIVKESKTDFFGNSPPSIFIGSKLYPNVNVGILAPPEQVDNAWLYDAEGYWVKNDYSIENIVNLRSNLVNSRFRSNVHDVKTNNKFIELSQEIAMAIKPVDIEVELKKKINLKLDVDGYVLPRGPSAPLKRIKIINNPKISNKIEKVVDDFDLKAEEAVNYLYNKGFDNNTLTKLLSVGVLGLKKNRKLVPTRFSITAVDDIIGKNLLRKIKDYKIIENCELHYGYYFGNFYAVMFFPDIFSYELFESYLPKSSWNRTNKIQTTTDYEDYYGRKNYAANTVGGYYASRLGVLEYLNNKKRQASVLVLRFETPDYWFSLGVFVVREVMRKVLGNKIVCENKEEIIKKAREIILTSFRFDINGIINQSKILNNLKTQMKLTSFN